MSVGVFLLVSSVCLFEPSLAALAASPSTDPALTLTATPTSMHHGFTEDLTLTCTHLQQPGSPFTTLMSVILSRVDSDENHREIAAITSVSPNNVTIKDNLNGHVTGQLVKNGQTSITYQWHYPSDDIVGEYDCEAHGMDAFGHHLVSSASTVISSRAVDHDAILQRLMQIDLDHQAQLDNQKNQLMDKQTQIDQLKAQLTTQTSHLDDVIYRLDEYREASIEFSSSFRGHEYLISRPLWRDTTVYDGMCRLFGGYLAEIDDQQEYDFVYSLIKSKGVTDWVFVSGTDDDTEGVWVHQRQGDRVGYFHWGGSDPSNGAGEDCIMLYSSADFTMYDNSCKSKDWKRFLCEVPT